MSRLHKNSDTLDLHDIYLEAVSRFDHFVMGATLAVCAYLAQSNPYDKIGLNIPTSYLVSLLLFGGAAFCGFKRLEKVVMTLRHNVDLLDAQERRKSSVSLLRDVTHAASKSSHRYYMARNLLLLLGFVVYIATKVASSY
jgi:hypothetical protein